MKKVFIQTLGCDKNTVDSENMAAMLVSAGCAITDVQQNADVVIINTCGFINDAKKQSIETIFDAIRDKKPGQKLIASGCMVQRYADELIKDIPEIDYFLGVNDYSGIADIVNGASDCKMLTNDSPDAFEELPRIKPGSATAYIRIAEGCDNHCTYCAIPMMRGRYRSRKAEDIIKEANFLAENGVKELIVIAQDVTYYGMEKKGRSALADLLHRLCRVEGLKWIRLMYCYEDEITDDLIQTIKSERKICKYIDIPLQHCDDKILKLMNRKSTERSIKLTINKLRKAMPEIIIRTTLITGFPGETKKEFGHLLDFVSEMRFDRLGVFAYSREEGTAAARMEHQVREDAKQRRRDKIMALQQHISLENNVKFIGKTLDVLIEEALDDGTYTGRTSMDAPEIDNAIIVTSQRILKPGMFIRAYVTDAFDYDLCAEEVLSDIN